MEKIFIIGNATDSFCSNSGYGIIECPDLYDDGKIHDFVVSDVFPPDFEKLIIPVSVDDAAQKLRLGMHIRVTKELHERRLVALLFVSVSTLDVLLRKNPILGRLLATEGCDLVKPSYETMGTTLENLESLQIEDLNLFLSTIQLTPDEKTGRHSLANQYGAYKLDSCAGTMALSKNEIVNNAKKTLYFKYVEAVNFKHEKLRYPYRRTIQLHGEKPDTILARKKRILLIDDEAKSGWEDVLRKLLKTDSEEDFKVICKNVASWDGFSDSEKNRILNGDYDVFLIDLRLNGSNEEDVADPKDFSGFSVLEAIKKHNKGNQAMIFTASSKAWNLKRLLDCGADGYYIKESPEYHFTENFSNENFKNLKNEIEKCLQYSFLRKIFDIHEEIRKHLNSKNGINSESRQKKDLRQKIINELNIADQLLSLKSDTQCNYYLTIYVRVFELLSNFYIEPKDFLLRNGERMMFFSENKENGNYSREDFPSPSKDITLKQYTSIANKTQAIACQCLSFDLEIDKTYLKDVGAIVKYRNDFLHEGKMVKMGDGSDFVRWATLMEKILTRID